MEETMTLGAAAGKLFPLLSNMMGPIGITHCSPRSRRTWTRPRAAGWRAAGFGFAALFLAVFLGSAMQGAWGIGNGALIFAAGLIVTSTALLPLLWNGGGNSPVAGTKQSPEQLAVTPLAFPGIVTPRAVGVLISVAFFPTYEGKLTVFAVVGLVMLLNLLAMRYARWFMQNIGMTPLLVLGAVFGVLQVALGVEMMADGFKSWSSP